MCRCVCVYTRVWTCENRQRREGILLLLPSHPSPSLPARSPPMSLRLRGCPCPLDPLSLTLLLLGCHPRVCLCAPPRRPFAQHPVSLGWHRNAGYLGNHCGVSPCDWLGWGPTLGWWADLGGESCPWSPYGEGYSLEHERNRSVLWWAGLPSWGGDSCPNKDSESQNEAT